jgi:hypothetical protein
VAAGVVDAAAAASLVLGLAAGVFAAGMPALPLSVSLIFTASSFSVGAESPGSTVVTAE